MKLIDVYNKYKLKYKDYVIIIKSGIFYNVFNEDTSILYNIFGYKIKNNGNNFIIGFPIKSLSKICSILENNKINYIIINKDDKGNFFEFDLFKTKNNKYLKYNIDLNKLNYINYKIDCIYNKLKEKIMDNNIEKILLNIEEIL